MSSPLIENFLATVLERGIFDAIRSPTFPKNELEADSSKAHSKPESGFLNDT